MKNLLYIILFLALVSTLYSQNFSDVIEEEIENKVKSTFGNQYYLDEIVIVDSIINSKFNDDQNFQDPYRTLESCILFTVEEHIDNNTNNGKGLFGVYKNGDIIWTSGINIPLTNVLSLKSYGSMELNKDGKVELMFSSNFSGYQSQMNLWIYAWDGNSGIRINDVDDDSQSTLFTASSANFEFPDINGDGILEIQGYEIYKIASSSEDSLEVPLFGFKDNNYSWNGSEYGKWNNTPQTDSLFIYPRNKLNSDIMIITRSKNDTLAYTYKLNNSIQAINEFVLGYNVNNIYGFNSEGWSFSKNGTYLGWLTSNTKNFIYPGEKKEFSLVGSKLPQIVECFLLGHNKVNYNISPITELSINSVHKYTIGPRLIPPTIVPNNFIDTLLNFSIRSYELGWISDIVIENKYDSLFTSAKTQLQQNNNNAARTTLQTVLQEVDVDSSSNLTSEAYALIKYNTEYLLQQIPEQPNNPNLIVNLKNSLGNPIPASNVQYYEGSWKDAVNNGDGTFTVITTKPKVSIRVYYEYASMQVDNVPAQNNTYTFTTVNAAVQLKNSLGNLIYAGSVQYYAGAWRTFGTTTNGVATKELLPINYSFRMTYEYASMDKQQNLSADPTVVFQTVNAAVQLKNSLGNLMPAPMGDQGTVQYYAGAWRSFGTTTNGVATKELLPINYSFRMTYEYGSIDKQQNLSVDPTVVFQTVNAAVQLKNSLGNLIDQGTVQYYAGAWRSFGTTTNGVATKELLPINYSFRMTYEYVSKDKQQNLSTNPVVEFSTVLCTVKVSNPLANGNNQPISNAAVKYYAGAWRNLGTTNSSGIATKELLPANISFRASFGNVSLDKQQDISVNSLVEILLNIAP